jgi:prevent-host-death family protein
MAKEIPVTQARAEFADLVNRVVYGGERIVMTRHGKPLVALVSADDLELLEKLDHSGQATVVRMNRHTAGATERRLDIAAKDQPPSGGATPRY